MSSEMTDNQPTDAEDVFARAAGAYTCPRCSFVNYFEMIAYELDEDERQALLEASGSLNDPMSALGEPGGELMAMPTSGRCADCGQRVNIRSGHVEDDELPEWPGQ